MILLGDLHLGVKKFDREICRRQVEYLKRIIDKATEDDSTIFQLGDIFDNRTSVDIYFLTQVRGLFDYLVKKKVILYTLLGNHDIFWKNSRETSLVQQFADLYPKNFIVYKEREVFTYGDKRIYIVPWITKDEKLRASELKGIDACFGHFEINGFEVVKGHTDDKSSLTEAFFKKADCVVYSGHYHIRQLREYIKYLGTPFQLNWNDFNERKGYYTLSKDLELEFFENSDEDFIRHIKILYDDSSSNPILIQGFRKDIYGDLETLKENLEKLRDQNIKFFVNKSSDQKYEDYLYILKENNINFEFLNNQKISELIETSYIDEDSISIKPSRELITDYLKSNNPELMDIYLELLEEIKTQD